MHRSIGVLVCLFCGLLAGCATGYNSAVSALAAPNALENRQFVVTPAQEVASDDPLQLNLFTQYVDRMLTLKGFTKAPSRANSNVVVYLGYSVSGPRQQTQYRSEPIYGQTGVEQKSVQQTTGNTVTTTTQYVPTYGIVGYKQVPFVETLYDYRVWLRAISRSGAAQRKTKETELWEVSAALPLGFKDLRKVFPYMLAAMAPYVGQSTSGQVIVEVPDDNPELKRLLTATSK